VAKRRAPDGREGEIIVTDGFNFCLLLLRYRTGDRGRLATVGGERLISDLQGRAPVRFRDATGEWRNNIEVSHALKHLPLASSACSSRPMAPLRWGLPNDRLTKRTEPWPPCAACSVPSPVNVAALTNGKHLQYRSELDGAS